MSSYNGYTHIENNYVFDKLVVGAVKDNVVYVFVCDKPNCETEWEDVCYCIDNGKIADKSEIRV
jgi:hypothetical protein